MAKEEGGGRLLSKVARFVRNPLKDWSDLDGQDRNNPPSAVDSEGYSREALKELIERRQRNDFVRRREFDMLRKMRQREASGQGDAGNSLSSFHLNTAGKTDGRALTLKKIDEIEEQMSQQWWKGRTQPAGLDASRPDPLSAEHARAYADTAPGAPPTEDGSSTEETAPPDAAPGLSAAHLVYETDLDEAAIRFAEGKDALTENLLVQAIAPDGAHADDDDAWRALLDFYRATGDAENFAAASMRYAQRFRRPAPEWVSLRALARNTQDADAEDAMDWYCPAQLSRAALLGLTQALGRAGPVWRLDWRALRGIDADAAAPLGSLFGHWADSPVQLRFAGADRLLAVLAEATPLTVRDTDIMWWQLHLATLRLLHQADQFELVALNYCITYEAAPPPWQEPVGSCAVVRLGATRPGALHEPQPAAAGARASAQLSGDIVGDSPHVWQRLEAELAASRSSRVSCAALVRLDLAATAGLLRWVADREAQGQRVELIDAHRMLALLFGVVGIAGHAGVSVRN